MLDRLNYEKILAQLTQLQEETKRILGTAERLVELITQEAYRAAIPEEEIGIDSERIGMLGLSLRAQNCLMRADIYTVGALTNRSSEELKEIRGLGDVVLEEIQAALALQGKQLLTRERIVPGVVVRNSIVVSDNPKEEQEIILGLLKGLGYDWDLGDEGLGWAMEAISFVANNKKYAGKLRQFVWKRIADREKISVEMVVETVKTSVSRLDPRWKAFLLSPDYSTPENEEEWRIFHLANEVFVRAKGRERKKYYFSLELSALGRYAYELVRRPKG